jgi:formylglycine-generating enzyme required for sulfatase activity
MNRVRLIGILSAGLLIFVSCATTPHYVTSPTGLALVEIGSAGDSFTMGDGSTGADAILSFSYSFRMSRHEITNAFFTRFVQDGGYNSRVYWTDNGWAAKNAEEWTVPQQWPGMRERPNHPAGAISWYEAVAFCNWLSRTEGLAPAYDRAGKIRDGASGYRLPTEAEWEYAAAKGGPRNAERLYAYGDAWNVAQEAAALPGPIDVGSRSAAGGDTPQGLADIGGNIREWCSDNWVDDGDVVGTMDRYIFSSDADDQRLCMRGGPYHRSTEEFFRVASREPVAPSARGSDYGFRVVIR